jgi:hypothetical protein
MLEKRAYHQAAVSSLSGADRIEEAEMHLDAVGILSSILTLESEC